MPHGLALFNADAPARDGTLQKRDINGLHLWLSNWLK